MSGKSKVSLTLMQKIQVIADAEQNSKDELCHKYKCSKTTINRVLKNKDLIFEKSKRGNLSVKRLRSGACEKVERALVLWFNQMRESGAVISQNMLFAKAKQFSVEMNQDFNPSSGWLHRWKKREGISLKKLQGEEAPVTAEATHSHTSSALPNLISQYDPKHIFLAGESGLFFRALPTSYIKREEGLKRSRERLTLFFICNATGEYKKVIVIGKSRNPCCFKNKTLPLQYYPQQKLWMTQNIWSDILISLDAEMGKQNQKIILFVDNAASHNTKVVLSSIDLQYLPVNKIADAHPLNQGIIQRFKSYYRRTIIRKKISAIESGKTIEDFVKSLNIFTSMHIIQYAWSLVEPIYISHCFKKANLIPPSHKEQFDTSMEEEIVTECHIFDNILQDEFEEYIRCDDNLACNGQLTNEDIVQEILETRSSDSSDEDETVKNPPSTQEILSSLNTLREFLLSNNKFSIELESMEKYIVDKICNKGTDGDSFSTPATQYSSQSPNVSNRLFNYDAGEVISTEISKNNKCMPTHTLVRQQNLKNAISQNPINRQYFPANDRWKSVFSEYILCELDRYEYHNAQKLKNNLNMVCLNFQPTQEIIENNKEITGTEFMFCKVEANTEDDNEDIENADSMTDINAEDFLDFNMENKEIT